MRLNCYVRCSIFALVDRSSILFIKPIGLFMSNYKTSQTPVAFSVLENPLEIPGFVNGLRHPSLVVRLAVRVENHKQWLVQVNEAFADVIRQDFGDHETPHFMPADNEQKRAVSSLFFWMSKLQQIVKVPVFEPAKVIGFDSKTSSLRIAIPTLSSLHRSTGKLFFWLLKVFNGVYAGEDVHLLLKDLPLIIKEQEQMVPPASNMPRFLKAAFTNGIPYSEITGHIYQFGYGFSARLLDSSFTDQTSRIGVWVARNKILTARFLRLAGIPVPDHKVVSDVKDAEKAAYELGFPVVVKPADLDGGVGVSAGLTTTEEVCKAFVIAGKKSNTILVEKHHYGRDYRLTVFQNELIWAVERIPGGVTGDGKSSIQLLVEQVNKDPQRGNGAHSPLKRLVLDNEAKSLLSKMGITAESVPGLGEFVCLRRTANVANGGSPVAVFEKVHPDNRLLAIRAAAALHLDLAGIDLLIPDISRSWLESGAAVCEVNAQPNIGETTATHLYLQILRNLLHGRGRIPIAVIIGASPKLNVAEAIAARLSQAGLTPGWSDHKGVFVGTEIIAGNEASPYMSGRVLAGEKGVKALLLCINDMSVLRTGLPFDRFDLLIVAGAHITSPDSHSDLLDATRLRTIFDVCSPSCVDKVLIMAEPDMVAQTPFELLPKELLKSAVSPLQMVFTITEAMIEADRRHRIGG